MMNKLDIRIITYIRSQLNYNEHIKVEDISELLEAYTSCSGGIINNLKYVTTSIVYSKSAVHKSYTKNNMLRPFKHIIRYVDVYGNVVIAVL